MTTKRIDSRTITGLSSRVGRPQLQAPRPLRESPNRANVPSPASWRSTSNYRISFGAIQPRQIAGKAVDTGVSNAGIAGIAKVGNSCAGHAWLFPAIPAISALKYPAVSAFSAFPSRSNDGKHE